MIPRPADPVKFLAEYLLHNNPMGTPSNPDDKKR